MARPVETDKVRRWDGVTAAANEIGEFRVWVVWGVTTPPEHAAVVDEDHFPPGAAGNDIATALASQSDPEFADADDDYRWVMIVEGSEADVDEWVSTHDDTRGYVSYLLEAGLAAQGSP